MHQQAPTETQLPQNSAEGAAPEQDHRFHDLIDSLDAIVWEADPVTFQCTFASRQAEALLGYPVERWLREPGFLVNLIHPEDRDATVAACLAEIAAGRDHVLEYRMVAADGRVVWVRDMVRVAKDELGRPKQLRSVLVDVTEHRLLEQALHASEERFRRLAEHAPDLIFRYRLEPDRGFDYVNPAALAITGYSPAEHYADPDLPLKIVHPEDRHVLEQLLRHPEAVDGQVFTIRWVRKDGAVIWAEERKVAVRDAAGRVVAIEGITRDVSQRTQLADEVRQSESRFRTLVEMMSEGLVQVDNNDVVQFVNQRFCDMLGYTREELIGHVAADLIVPAEERHIIRQKNRLRLEGVQDRYQVHVRKKTGEMIWAEIAGAPVVDAEGTVIGSVGIHSDITERKQAEESLRASEERFRTLLQAVPGVILLLAPDHRILEFNQEAERLYGCRREDVLGKNYLELFLPAEARDAVAADGAKVLAGTPTRGFENPVTASTGEKRILSWNVDRVLDHQGQAVGLLTVGQDVTERRRAHEERSFMAKAGALLGSSLDYSTVLEGIAALAVPYLADWCTIDVMDENGAIRSLASTHADPAKIAITRELVERYPLDPHSAHPLARALSTGEAQLTPAISDADLANDSINAEHLRLRRELGVCSRMVAPLRARGKVLGTLTFHSARPEHRYGPEDLRLAEHLAQRAALAVDNAALYREAEEERELLRTVITQVPIGVLIARSSDGKFSHWNETAERILGFSLKDRQAGDFQYVDPTGQPYPVEDLPLQRALHHSETTVEREVDFVRAGGVRGVLSVNAAPVPDQSGRIRAAVAVFHDVTRRKTLEEQKSEFLSLAAHELRSPLTVVNGNVQLVARGLRRLSDQCDDIREASNVDISVLQHCLHDAENSVKAMTRLVEELLDFSRIESNYLAIVPEPVDLAALTREVVARHQTQYPDRSYSLNCMDLSVCGDWDRLRLEQVLTNLLDNAAKYSEEGSGIDVHVDAGDGQAQVTVRDHGMGIPAADLPHIFERHFRASNINRHQTGLGLGLYLSAQIVERHGGRLWADSREGEGSRFFVALPLPADSVTL